MAIPFLKIEADNNYEFGFKLGKALKKQIQYRIEKNKILYRKNKIGNFLELEKRAKKFIPIIQKKFPELLIEAMAMARGAEVPFEKLMVIMCDLELVSYSVYLPHCTSVAIKNKANEILLGHNEDWFPEYKKSGLFLIKGKFKNTRFLSLSYVGCLVGTGGAVNSHGIAYTDNTLNFEKYDYNIPRSFHLRALLEAKTPSDVVKTLNKEGSTVSNTTLVWKNSKMLAIEELWNRRRLITGKKWLVHTNHPLRKRDQNKKNTDEESVLRYNRAKEILLQEKNFDIKTLKKILSDHKTDICEHLKKTIHGVNQRIVTVASMIMNPSRRWMMLCEGNPCKGRYKKYKF